MITWTIGAGGLLGSAIQRNSKITYNAPRVNWLNSQEAVEQLTQTAQNFQREVDQEPWSIMWVAGNAATSSSSDDTAKELAIFQGLLQAIAQFRPVGQGAFFMASSAGGVYAGSVQPPFTEFTEPQALSPYGELKLAQETAAIATLQGVCPVVIGRISNLYGPGQNLNKLQGLISRLALAAVRKQPVNMFVSLDTMRDYIYSDDAAKVAIYWTHQAADEQHPTPQIKVIASGQPVSLGYLIHLMQDVARTKIPVAFGSHASSSAQALDLRLTPTNQNEIDGLLATPLSAGTKRVYLDMLERYQSGTD